MKKVWFVCSVLLVVLIASPAQAVNVNAERQFKDASGTKLGCVLQINKVTKDYHPDIRYLRVKAAILCRKDVRLYDVGIKFQPVAGGSRHLTEIRVSDDNPPFSRHFTALAQCNRIMPGASAWNHPFARVTLGTRAITGQYDAHLENALPWDC